MITLKNHNASASIVRQSASTKNVPTGILCDECGGELRYRDTRITNTGNPMSKWVDCPGCGFTGLVYL